MGPPDQVSSAISKVGCERPSPRACSPLASSPLKHIPLGSSLIRGHPHHEPDSAPGHTPTWAPHGNPDLHLGQRAGVPGRLAPQPRMQPFLSHPLIHSVHSPTDVWGATSRACSLLPRQSWEPSDWLPGVIPQNVQLRVVSMCGFFNKYLCSPSVAGRLRVPKADRVGCFVLYEHPRGLVSTGLLEPMPLRC